MNVAAAEAAGDKANKKAANIPVDSEKNFFPTMYARAIAIILAPNTNHITARGFPEDIANGTDIR